MRIAWFTHRYHPCIGGAEAYSRAVVRRLVAAGHQVDVITSDAHDLWYFTDPNRRRVDAGAESWVDGARIRRLPIRHIPLRRYVVRLLGLLPHWPTRCRFAPYMPIVPGLESIRGDYDVVFGVGFPYTVFSFAAYRTARAADAPLILTPFLHLATPGDVVNRHYTRPHQIRLLAHADLIVSPTTLEKSEIASWGIPATRLLTLPMAIEPAEVMGGSGPRFRQLLGIPTERRVVGQLGALDPNKGTTDLIRALIRINEERANDDPVHLILAGAPSPDFESFANRLPESASSWLSIVGPLPVGDVPDFYAAIDVFAMPSRTDSFGIVFLEAWANARPVVAAAAGGVSEVVEDGRTGLLVPFGDVPKLAEAIGSLVVDRAMARRLGEAGRSRVNADAGWDDRVDTLMDRVGAILSLHHRRHPPETMVANAPILDRSRIASNPSRFLRRRDRH